MKIHLKSFGGFALAAALAAVQTARGAMVITPTFTANFNTNFGANAPAAQASWIAAANVFTTHFNDNIHVNIIVDAVTGTSVFGRSNYFLNSTSYGNLLAKVVADAKSADDLTAVSPVGSMTLTDPTGGAGTWWVNRAEAKAIGLIADDFSNDGKTTFGTGNSFTFSGAIVGGTYDFKGIAAHEISEVLGRQGSSGVVNPVSAVDLRLLDVIGYDIVPEPSGGILTGLLCLGAATLRRRRND